MTVAEAIKVALATNDDKLAVDIVECLTLKFHGTMRYADMLAMVARVTGRDVSDVGPEWDSLLADGGAQ